MKLIKISKPSTENYQFYFQVQVFIQTTPSIYNQIYNQIKIPVEQIWDETYLSVVEHLWDEIYTATEDETNQNSLA